MTVKGKFFAKPAIEQTHEVDYIEWFWLLSISNMLAYFATYISIFSPIFTLLPHLLWCL